MDQRISGLISWLLLILALFAWRKYGARSVNRDQAKHSQVRDWFHVSFDKDWIRLAATPPNSRPWRQEFRWDEITRVCFKSEDFIVSDGIYFFTTRRPESYVVPVDGDGGEKLWHEVVDRDLFDPELAISAMACSEEKVFCWPEN